MYQKLWETPAFPDDGETPTWKSSQEGESNPLVHLPLTERTLTGPFLIRIGARWQKVELDLVKVIHLLRTQIVVEFHASSSPSEVFSVHLLLPFLPLTPSLSSHTLLSPTTYHPSSLSL